MTKKKLTYAIADLHGRFDLLSQAYAEIIEHSEGPATIVHLGDYVDRGPQSRAILEFLMDPDTAPTSCRRIILKGNHEDMMVSTLRAPLHPKWWIGNGGGQTLISYGHARSGDYCPDVVPGAHVEWLESLPLMHVDRHRIFVHAGVDPTLALDQQTDEYLLWSLYPDGFADGHGNHHVVHGHHQFAHGPKLFAGRSDLDTFAWYTGRLVVGVFDDDIPGGAIEFIEIKGPPAA